MSTMSHALFAQVAGVCIGCGGRVQCMLQAGALCTGVAGVCSVCCRQVLCVQMYGVWWPCAVYAAGRCSVCRCIGCGGRVQCMLLAGALCAGVAGVCMVQAGALSTGAAGVCSVCCRQVLCVQV